MKKAQYLLDKLAEEAAEVAQAAIKHKYKRTAKSARRLADELGDLLGVLEVLADIGKVDQRRVRNTAAGRGRKERGRMK